MGQGEFRDRAGWRDPANPVAGGLGKPQVPIRTGLDAARRAVPGGNVEFPDGSAVLTDLSDSIPQVLREPDVPIRTHGHDTWPAIGMRKLELDDPDVVLAHASNPVPAELAEP
jgi:hypothetical protein